MTAVCLHFLLFLNGNVFLALLLSLLHQCLSDVSLQVGRAHLFQPLGSTSVPYGEGSVEILYIELNTASGWGCGLSPTERGVRVYYFYGMKNAQVQRAQVQTMGENVISYYPWFHREIMYLGFCFS